MPSEAPAAAPDAGTARPGARGGDARAGARAGARSRPSRRRPSVRLAAGVETIRVETVGDASNAAARLLELASRNADQLVEDAKSEADKIIGEARTKAERLESESKTNADKLEADARGRAQSLDAETAERRTQLFGDLERERDTPLPRGRQPAGLRARVPLAAEDLLQPAARGPRDLRLGRPDDARGRALPSPSGCARSSATTRADPASPRSRTAGTCGCRPSVRFLPRKGERERYAVRPGASDRRACFE